MGSSSPPYFLVMSLSVIIPQALGCFSSIFSFGDSITDTGNLLSITNNSSFYFFLPPYGETYFHHPTGRCSDGRLIIDFIAEYLGLPLVPAYLELKSNLTQNVEGSVNFAMVGATALDAKFLTAMGDSNEFTNSSLGTQLHWFEDLLPSLCNTSSNCNKLFSSSLVLVGEIGGNDYNDALLGGKSVEQVQTYVPLVIQEISLVIKKLIELGAVTLLVPGNFPIGCIPVYLTQFETSDENQYNSSTGCLTWLNKFSEYHNEQLQIELNGIRKLYPNVSVIYADYYNAVLDFYKSPENFGFLIGGTLKACCGGGGPYNYNSSARCGSLEASACDNPAQFINWDGVHFTEAAYRWITKGLLGGNYTIPSISTLCVSEV